VLPVPFIIITMWQEVGALFFTEVPCTVFLCVEMFRLYGQSACSCPQDEIVLLKYDNGMSSWRRYVRQ
jgi:hypothetical protein